MTRYQIFPDAEALAGYVLREANIENLEDRVYSSVPKDPVYPLVVVRRLGGVPAEEHHLDQARIQVDVWGGSKSVVHDIAQEARVALLEASGEQFRVADDAPVDAFVTRVRDDLGLSWQPDPTTNRDRYVFGVAIYLH